MKSKTKKIIITVISLLVITIAGLTGTAYWLLMGSQFFPQKTVYVYIDRDDNVDSVFHKVQAVGEVKHFQAFKWLADYKKYDKNIHTGRYAIQKEDDVYHVFSRLLRGYQVATKVTVPSVRTLDRLASSLGKQLMVDSAEIASVIYDSIFQVKMSYTKETMPCLFIPNTYAMYWDTSVGDLMNRMRVEHEKFWNQSRTTKASEIGLSEHEVMTLASIVEEETNNNDEKPMVAGLYMNRLHKKMPLQADPTVKFALQEFGIKRILNSDLAIDSPYNTYKNLGLPPGPIRIPSIAGIEAVLNYTSHNYIYMCAKEDFSGTHNFASTYSEHVRNAQRYWAALNQKKIKR